MGRRLVQNSGNDRIYTPDALARSIVRHFKPKGTVLEPCAGAGAFIRAFKHCGVPYDWCEIDRNRDFFKHHSSAEWVITNPPFSKIRKFLSKCYSLDVPDVVFLCTLNAFWMNGKINEMEDNGYFIKEIALVESPYFRRLNGWPQSGFSLAATHICQVDQRPASIKLSTIQW